MSSRFKELFEEVKQEEQTPVVRAIKKPAQKKPDSIAPAIKPAKLKGKRNNPEYTGAFAYIPGKLHEDVKVKLLRKKDLDFSELIEQLLTQWLSDQK